MNIVNRIFMRPQEGKYKLLLSNILKKKYNRGYSSASESVQLDACELPASLSPSEEIRKYLRKDGRSFEEGFACFATPCFECPQSKDKNAIMYINKVTGFFSCSECDLCGSWQQLHHSGDGKRKKLFSESPNLLHATSETRQAKDKWNAVVKTCRKFSSLTSDERMRIAADFKFPNVRSCLVVLDELEAHVGSDYTLYIPLTNGKKHICGVKELEATGEEISFPPKDCVGIVRYIPAKVKRKHDEAIIVSGIRDIVALSAYKHSYHVICCAHGSVALPQEILPILEHYKKLVIWFGNDSSRLQNALMFVKKLGKERCYIVKGAKHELDHLGMVSRLPTASFVAETIKNAQSAIHPNIINFSSLRHDVLSQLQNVDSAQGVKWKRFPLLTEILKGHRSGELTVLTGPTGSGKTTFVSEYSLDLAMQGVSTLFGSFEIRNQRLAQTMMQQMALVPLAKNVGKFEEIADAFQKLPIYFMTFHGPQPINVVMEVVHHGAYVHDIKHLVVDNLQFMMGSCEKDAGRFTDRFHKQDTVIEAFRAFATHQNCHVTLIIHPRKEKDGEELTPMSIFGGAKASQEADNILIIQKRQLQTLAVKKYLQVAKNRFTGDLGIVPLPFDKLTSSFASKKM